MFDRVIAGLRRAGFADGEIEYFSRMWNRTGSRAWLEEALVRYSDTPERREQSGGAMLSLSAREQFGGGG